MSVTFAISVAILVMVTLGRCSVEAAAVKPKVDEPITAFLCADNGTFSGQSELSYVAQTVFQQESISIPYCQSATFGYTYAAGNRIVGVVLVTTGIGEASAASCTQSLLSNSGYTFSRMIFVGTSGWSPVLGGFLPTAPGGCAPLSNPTTIAVGSVCVTSAAVDMSCGMCISNPAVDATNLPNECSRPNCNGHTQESMYGPCIQHGSVALANQIRESNSGIVFPSQPSAVKSGTMAWWAANQAAPQSSRLAPPFVPILTGDCVEADAHQIWVGAPMDYLCREYASEILGTNSQFIPCVVAMESTGFLAAVRGYSSFSGDVIDAVVIRAASNWDMYPLVSATPGSVNDTLRWVQNTTYTSEASHLEFVKAGYQYAVNTSNQVILNFIKKYL